MQAQRMRFWQLFTLVKEGLLALCGHPYQSDKKAVARFEHVESAEDDLVLGQELLVHHHNGYVISIFQRIVHVQVVDKLGTRPSDKFAYHDFMRESFLKIFRDRVNRGLENVKLKAMADTHDDLVNVCRIVENDAVAL